jgi:hypothetical protein
VLVLWVLLWSLTAPPATGWTAFVPQDHNDNTDDLMARFDEANKEYNLIRSLGDLYVSLLRCSRSPDLHFRQEAAQGLLELVRTLALHPKTPITEAVEAASKRVGWQEEPEDEFHKSLNFIARAAITYLIEASGYSDQRLLSRRTKELVRAIDEFQRRRG